MPLTEDENCLRAWRRTGPEWIPFRASLTLPLWDEIGGELERIVARHPSLFPDGVHRPSRQNLRPYQRAGEGYTDMWGCTWRTDRDGVTGVVVASPLAEGWHRLDSYTPPDPARQLTWTPIDWHAERARIAEAKREGRLAGGSTDHGFFFMRLYYLRGFQNLMIDMAEDDPHLQRLIAIIEKHYRYVVGQYAAMGVDLVGFGEDLGTQTASMMGPRHFRRYVAPTYRRLFAPVHACGALVKLHSDGYIMDIMDDILASGVDVINPQDLVNGVDPLAREVKGRAVIDLDLDRQSLIPFGDPADIRTHVESCVRKLGAPEGGLSFVVGLYPPTPPENVEALFSAVEEYRTWWRDGRGRR